MIRGIWRWLWWGGGGSGAVPSRAVLAAVDSSRVALTAVDSSRVTLNADGVSMAEPEQQTFRLAIGQAKVVEFVATLAPTASVAGDAMRFRLRSQAGAILIEKSTGSGITCTQGAPDVLSRWEVLIGAADTFGRGVTNPATPANLSPGVYKWALWNVDAGEQHPLAYGTCTLYRTAETG